MPLDPFVEVGRPLVRPVPPAEHRGVLDLVLAAAAFALLLVAAGLASYRDARGAARAALREALDRGDIRPEEYAAHIRALEDAA